MEEDIRIDPKTILYNDIVFRSATEARWAMYFDEMGIKYKYEPHYIALAKINQSYLPDFYLPDLEMYVEIKRSGEYSFTYTKIEGDWTEVTCENSPGAYQRIEKYLYAAEYFLKKRCLYLLLMGDPYDIITSSISDAKGIIFDAVVAFKQKWFQGDRAERFKKYLDEEYQKLRDEFVDGHTKFFPEDFGE